MGQVKTGVLLPVESHQRRDRKKAIRLFDLIHDTEHAAGEIRWKQTINRDSGEFFIQDFSKRH
jgi:hypothetical protein